MIGRHASQSGFTVLEALVAFTILVSALVMAFRLYSDGLPRLSHANERRNEIERALSVASHLRLLRNLTPGKMMLDGRQITLIKIEGIDTTGVWVLRAVIQLDTKDAVTTSLETVVVSPKDQQ